MKNDIVMKREVAISKIIATLIIVLTLAEIAKADEKITELFKKYHAPVGLTAIVEAAGKKYDIDPKVIAAIIIVESSAKPNAISKGGDYGLMQVRWKVHKKDIQRQYPQVKTAKNLLDAKINVDIGTQIFARYQQSRTLRNALIRYSGGNKNMAEKVLKILRKIQ